MSSAEQESSDTDPDTGVPASSSSALSNPSTTSSPTAPSSSEEEQHTTSLPITSSGDNSGADPLAAARPGGEPPADPLAAARPGGEPPADQPQDAADGNSCGRENVDLHDDDSHGNSSSDTDESEDEDNRELLEEHDQDLPGPYCRFTLIPACAIRHWRCSCTSCAVLLGVVTVLLLALVGGTIFWIVEANQRSQQNITLSTYKEVIRLSSTTDHLFLESACINANIFPPYSTKVEIATMECSSPPNMTDNSFNFKGVLLPGLESTQKTQLVDHGGLAFYWHKGSIIKLATQPIPIERASEVTVFLLTDEVSFMDCAINHIEPREGIYVERGNWSVKPDSPQCHMSGNSGDFTCEFKYNVTRSNMYYICFYRMETAMLPSLPIYAYELQGDLQSYDTSQFHTACNLNTNQSCCTSYGRGLLNETCIFIKTDLNQNSSARYYTDLGAVFTVNISSSVRLSVIGLSVGLTIVCIIIVFVLTVLCVATIDRGRNGNERHCYCLCRL